MGGGGDGARFQNQERGKSSPAPFKQRHKNILFIKAYNKGIGNRCWKTEIPHSGRHYQKPFITVQLLN